MLILTLRTDKPEAEVGLYEDETRLAYETWQAHRELAETIHQKINELLEHSGKNLHDIQAVIAYKGPGSFTGLRIGLTVANTLAYGLSIPVLSAEESDWILHGIRRLQAGEDERVAMPEYGALPNITQQKK